MRAMSADKTNLQSGDPASDRQARGWFTPLATGQERCYAADGSEMACPGSGQDGEFRYGRRWSAPRFEPRDEIVLDALTGLCWTRDANRQEFPVTWPEALELAAAMNTARAFGYADWRLPNRRELLSLISHQARKPALPAGHPFVNVFLGWYWTSTSAAINPAYAWYINLEGGRMFYGRKDQYYLFWPVRGHNAVLAATGQQNCHDPAGRLMPCPGSGQDGEFQHGLRPPNPRFRSNDEMVQDRHTGLLWLRDANVGRRPLGWQAALDEIRELNRKNFGGRRDWRLPSINALESLVDCSRHSPALAAGHPFNNVQEVYWSSTTSFFETDWAWALYLTKGALGVGYKPNAAFAIWPVCGPT